MIVLKAMWKSSARVKLVLQLSKWPELLSREEMRRGEELLKKDLEKGCEEQTSLLETTRTALRVMAPKQIRTTTSFSMAAPCASYTLVAAHVGMCFIAISREVTFIWQKISQPALVIVDWPSLYQMRTPT